MEFRYTLTRKTCARAVYKRYFYENRIKVLVYTIILSVLSVAFLVYGIISGEKLNWLLFLASIVTLITVYYLPVSNARMIASAFERSQDFDFELKETGIVITPDGRNPKDISFEDISRVLELKEFYMISTGSRGYPIPKKWVSQEHQEMLTNAFSKNLNEKYVYQK